MISRLRIIVHVPAHPIDRMRGSTSFWLLLLVLLACGGMGAWWYFAPETMPAQLRAVVPASPKFAPTLYKWHDAKGGLHVTDVPPADRPYETVRYDPNVNVVPNVMPPGTPPKKD